MWPYNIILVSTTQGTTFTAGQNVIVLDIRTAVAALPALASVTLKNCRFYMIGDTLCVWIFFEFDEMLFPDAHSGANNSNRQLFYKLFALL